MPSKPLWSAVVGLKKYDIILDVLFFTCEYLVSLKEHHPKIYLLPNLFTTASLFAAFYSIMASFKMQYEVAVIAIFIGMIADGLDGRIARLTNTQTEFGAQYDSLSDMVTFAPSITVPPSALFSVISMSPKGTTRLLKMVNVNIPLENSA